MGFGTFLDGRKEIKIGNNVDIASEVMIYNSEHDLESEEFTAREEPVEIGVCIYRSQSHNYARRKNRNRCSGCRRSSRHQGCPHFAMCGIPAKVIGERKTKNPKYRLGRARLFQ